MITGHLEQDRDSTGRPFWRIRLDYGINLVTGKRKQPRVEGMWYDQRKARRRLAELLHEANHGPRVDPSKRTVHAALVEWLDRDARLTVRGKTFVDYESVVRNHIAPALGHIPLQQLTTAMVGDFRAGLLHAGKSHAVVSRSTLHLSQALAYAVRQGYLSHNPAQGLRRMAAPHREMQVWTAEQAAAFLTTARGATYSPLWLVALSTGMRLGELRALRWADVDLERGVLAVRRSVDQYGDTNAPKSGRARTIDLDGACVSALREHRVSQHAQRLRLGASWQDGDLVFASETGTALIHRNLYRVLERLQAAARVPAIRFHDLRHTAATLMLQAGVPVKVVSERLGHANVTITLNIYAHVLPGMQRQAAETLGRLLSNRA